MEHEEILDLLNGVSDFKFLTRKWNIVIGQSNANYNAGNETNLCDYNEAYILVKGDITVTAAPERQVAFKNCAPFTKCFTKTD